MQASNINSTQTNSVQSSKSPPLSKEEKTKKKTSEITQRAVKTVQIASNHSAQSNLVTRHAVNLNNSQTFQNFNFYNLSFDFSSKTIELYIPVSELPENYIVKKNQDFGLENFHCETEPDSFKRLKKWRAKHYPTPVFEVITLRPLRISSMKTAEFKKKFDFGDLYSLLQSMGLKSNNTIELSDTNRNHSKLAIKQPINPLTTIDPQHFIELISCGNFEQSVQASELLTDLKKNLAKCITKYGSELSPYEPMYLIWDTLSQLVIKKHSLNELQKENCTLVMLEYWTKVRYSSYTFPLFGSTKNYEMATAFLNETIQLLKNLPSFLKERINFKHDKLCRELESVHSPLVNFFESLGQLKLEELSIFFKELNDFNDTRLNNLYECKINLNPSRRQIQEWLQKRLDCLILNLRLNSANPDLQSLLIDCEEIKTAFQKQNWLDAYNKICALYRQIIELNKPKSVSLFNLAKGKIPFHLSRERMGFFRSFEYSKALYKEFLSVVSNGKLFNVVSEYAYEELQKSSKILEIPFSKKNILHTEFKVWTSDLSGVNYKEIFDTLQVMKQAWKELKVIQAKFSPDGNIQKSLQILFQELDSQNYSELMHVYSKLSQEIKNPQDSWVQQLKILNQSIDKLQDHCILMLMDPQLPKIDLRILQSQFQLFNHRLAELIKPTTSFLNAFQQLICIDPASLKGVSEGSNEIFLRFTDEGAFTLNLFETGDTYFSSLQTQLEQIRKFDNEPLIVEIEEEYSESVPSDDKEISSSKTIEDEQSQTKKLTEDVEKIFQGNTKTRRIKKELIQLLKDYDINFNAKFGKGDHNKLYINGIPIVLPEHKEWKPGTLKSIQNSVIEMLQERIKEEKE